LIIILYTRYSSLDKLPEILFVLSVAMIIPTVILHNLSYDFNPSFTLMFYLDGQRTGGELFTFISSQMLAGAAAYWTMKLLDLKNL